MFQNGRLFLPVKSPNVGDFGTFLTSVATDEMLLMLDIRAYLYFTRHINRPMKFIAAHGQLFAHPTLYDWHAYNSISLFYSTFCVVVAYLLAPLAPFNSNFYDSQFRMY